MAMFQDDEWYPGQQVLPPEPEPTADVSPIYPSNPGQLTILPSTVQSYFRHKHGRDATDAEVQDLLSRFGGDWGSITNAIDGMAATPAPGPTGGPGPGPGPAPGPAPTGAGDGPTSFAWPTYQAPGFTPAGGFTPPGSSPYTPSRFSYEDFRQPTLEEARNEPGFRHSLEEGQDALQNAAAYRGTARTGGTLKDLFKWTNAASEQNYGNVFNRARGMYELNRGNAFQNWFTNESNAASAYGLNYNNVYGAARDAYDTGTAANQSNFENARQNATDTFNPTFDSARLSFADMYNRWLAKVNSATTLAGYGAA